MDGYRDPMHIARISAATAVSSLMTIASIGFGTPPAAAADIPSGRYQIKNMDRCLTFNGSLQTGPCEGAPGWQVDSTPGGTFHLCSPQDPTKCLSRTEGTGTLLMGSSGWNIEPATGGGVYIRASGSPDVLKRDGDAVVLGDPPEDRSANWVLELTSLS
jgi:hypothetical protein